MPEVGMPERCQENWYRHGWQLANSAVVKDRLHIDRVAAGPVC